MISLGSCVLVVVIITASVAETLPINNADLRYIGKPVIISEVRQKRTTNPARAIMYSGYFGSPQGYHYNPPYQGNTYDPQGAMASFAEGNTVSARSYYGNEYQPSNTYPHCGNCGYPQPSNGQGYPNAAPENTGEVLPPGDVISTQQPEEQSKEKPKPTVTDTPDVQVAKRNEQPEIENEAHIPTEPDIKPSNGNNKTIDIPDSHKSKTPRLVPNSPKEEDDDDQDYEEETNNGPSSFPGKNVGPGKNYNSYFPVYFGLPGYGSRSQGEGGPLNPGVATAIANSFSNGRGAVATSHATAYGGPNFDSGYKKGEGDPQCPFWEGQYPLNKEERDVVVGSGKGVQVYQAVLFPLLLNCDTVLQPVKAWGIGDAAGFSGSKSDEIL
uniref:Uncharacterized protein n=1 Tax=Timema shepardi TaxID=629360 RepID=A0A7R9AWM8_TIMSH|nr:unnamed protein product [Timema shepardi]